MTVQRYCIIKVAYTSKKPQKRAAILGSGLMQTEKLANQRFLLIFIFSLRLIRRSSGRSETNETDYDVNVSETTRGRLLSVGVENHKGFLNAYVSVCKMLWIFHGSISPFGIFLVSQNWRQLENNHTEDHTEKRFCGTNMKPKKTFPLTTKNKSKKYLGKRKDSKRITRKIWNSMGNILL